MVVRRRPALMASVAVLALAAGGGYLWWYGRTGGGLSLLFGCALVLLSAAHGLAWRDARTPLLVADDTGLRIRLGGEWRGLPWSGVAGVEVEPRGRLADGHVVVTPRDGGEVLDGARWRARLAAAVNRWVYDAPLVVPFGATTQLSVTDVPGELRRLAAGRAPVEVSTEASDEPAPTVELTSARTSEADTDDNLAPLPAASPAPAAAGAVPLGARRRVASAVSVLRPSSLRPSAQPPSPGTAVPSPALASTSASARREEVTMPTRSEPVAIGTLALSDRFADAPTEPLPELAELRRSSGDDFDGVAGESGRLRGHGGSYAGSTWSDGSAGSGNVALIIDATTDLSARAMQRVRRPGGAGSAGSALEAEPENGSPVGGELARARRRLALSVDEVAERTRIRPYVIESIESDDYAPCGGDFYARGHLRMLAKVLGLDERPLVEAYDDAFATAPVDARAVFDLELAPSAPGLVRGGTSGSSWRGLVAAVLLLLLVWGVAQYVTSRNEQTSSDLGVHNAAGLGSPGPGNRPLPAPAAPAEATVAAVGGSTRVVVTDARGNVVFSDRLRAGQSRLVSGPAPLRVRATDAAAFRLLVAGEPVGRPGKHGQPVRRVVAAP